MRRFIVCLVIVALLVMAQSALASELQVVVTFSVLQDLVNQVGGEKVRVDSIITFGADPHTFEPTPKEARLVAQADLLVANGAGLDDWLFEMMANAAKPNVELLIASQSLTQIEGAYHHGDPHFWLSVPNVIYYVEQIAQALANILPEEADYFGERASVYIRELEELDQWMFLELGRILDSNRIIITYHNAFSYLAERYGFATAEFLVDNPEAEPTPREIARLIDVLKGMEKKALFSEPQLSAGVRYMQTLAAESKANLYTLYSDSLSAEVSTYVEMMRYNTRTLTEALE